MSIGKYRNKLKENLRFYSNFGMMFYQYAKKAGTIFVLIICFIVAIICDWRDFAPSYETMHAFAALYENKQNPSLFSGEYYINNKNLKGKSKVEQTSNNSMSFRVYATSKPQGYTADLEGNGIITNNAAVFKGEDGCRLQIKFIDNGRKAIVSGGDETCRYYMGAGGGINGIYEKKTGAMTIMIMEALDARW